MMYYLLKFGYDGRNFSGYQRGNGVHSVEGEMLSISKKYGIAENFSSAARTDRGVSAAGNVIFFKSDMDISKITGILNSQAKDMVFHSYAAVTHEFRVRHSSSKHYRYFLFGSDIDQGRFSEALGKFQGTHDFTLYSRKDARSPVRTVEKTEVIARKGYIEVNVHGPNFVWNQIRAMIGFAKYYALTEQHIPDPFSAAGRPWALADPEPLILMDISYKGVDFAPAATGKKPSIWERKISDLELHSAVLKSIIDAAAP